METLNQIENKPRHINCFHLTRYASFGFLTTLVIFELGVLWENSSFPLFKFSGLMFLPFVLALWITVNTVGRKLYRPQSARAHFVLSYLGALMICYLTPTFFFIGAYLYDLMIKGTVNHSELLVGLLYAPIVGLIYGLPGTIIFGALLGKSVHKKVGSKKA